MTFSVSGDMTLRPGSSVALDVPGSAGTSLGVFAAVASDPSTERRCVGSGLSLGGGPDFVIRPCRSVVDARLSFCSYAWGQCRS
jgi:hypothetical protein